MPRDRDGATYDPVADPMARWPLERRPGAGGCPTPRTPASRLRSA